MYGRSSSPACLRRGYDRSNPGHVENDPKLIEKGQGLEEKCRGWLFLHIYVSGSTFVLGWLSSGDTEENPKYNYYPLATGQLGKVRYGLA